LDEVLTSSLPRQTRTSAGRYSSKATELSRPWNRKEIRLVLSNFVCAPIASIAVPGCCSATTIPPPRSNAFSGKEASRNRLLYKGNQDKSRSPSCHFLNDFMTMHVVPAMARHQKNRAKREHILRWKIDGLLTKKMPRSIAQRNDPVSGERYEN
jgi:hypothetical protein